MGGIESQKGDGKAEQAQETPDTLTLEQKGKGAIIKHLPYVHLPYAQYWKEAVVGGKGPRLWGLEVLSCSSAFALASSMTLDRLLNISGPLACKVSWLDQVIQDVSFCPDNL